MCFGAGRREAESIKLKKYCKNTHKYPCVSDPKAENLNNPTFKHCNHTTQVFESVKTTVVTKWRGFLLWRFYLVECANFEIPISNKHEEDLFT